MDNYKDRLPAFQFAEFFNGDLCAKGLVKSRNGSVNRKFVATIKAKSSPEKVELDELFIFDDQEQQIRQWVFSQTNSGWSGTAGDVVDIALGKTIGDSFNLTYQLKIKVDAEEYIVSMDDWLHQIDDTTLMGSTDMSKWGFNIGRVDIVIMKQDLVKQAVDKKSLIQNTALHVSNCIDKNYLTHKSAN